MISFVTHKVFLLFLVENTSTICMLPRGKKLETNYCTVSNSLSLNFDIFSDESDKSFGSRGESAVAEAEKAGTREPVVLRISGEIASCARRQSHQRGQTLLQQPASMRTFIHDIYHQKTVASLFLLPAGSEIICALGSRSAI
jgi:hypothetical protein